MKTSVIMIRKMGNFQVSQRTKDGMFNATDLLKQWNKRLGSKKELKEFFSNKATEEFIQTLEKEINVNGGNSPYLATRGKQGGTWMHPYLFIDFAMWINPKFKLDVIRFVYDQLIKFRHEAGDNYRSLAASISHFDGVNYPQVAKGLNWIVFDKHIEGMRQTATHAELERLKDVEKKLSFAVDMGYINSYQELIAEMRKIYHMEHSKF